MHVLIRMASLLPDKCRAILFIHTSQITQSQQTGAQQSLILTILQQHRHQSGDSSQSQQPVLLQICTVIKHQSSTRVCQLKSYNAVVRIIITLISGKKCALIESPRDSFRWSNVLQIFYAVYRSTDSLHEYAWTEWNYSNINIIKQMCHLVYLMEHSAWSTQSNPIMLQLIKTLLLSYKQQCS